MPDRRRHRGPHPNDTEWFAEGALPALRTACAELGWLLSRDYALESALALVGNRHALTRRQRAAVTRACCSDAERAARRLRARAHDSLAGETLGVDGFNCLIGVESALSGGVVLVGRDGAHRDLASVHGTYRNVDESRRAVELVLDALFSAHPRSVVWVLDSPVSNSGRVAQLVREIAAERGFTLEVELAHDADRVVRESRFSCAVSCDGGVLDRAGAWFDVIGFVIERHLPDAWVVNLGDLSELLC